MVQRHVRSPSRRLIPVWGYDMQFGVLACCSYCAWARRRFIICSCLEWLCISSWFPSGCLMGHEIEYPQAVEQSINRIN